MINAQFMAAVFEKVAVGIKQIAKRRPTDKRPKQKNKIWVMMMNTDREGRKDKKDKIHRLETSINNWKMTARILT